MKSLMLFLQVVLQDLGDWCRTSTTLDFKTIERRVEHEGLSFLTITLTNFGKDFEKSLDQGFVGHDQFVGFQRSGSLPRLLGGFFDQVFDRSSGRLLDIPDLECIRALRQACLMFGKILLPCSETRIHEAFRSYVECEKEMREWDAGSEDRDWSSFDRVSTLLWGSVFSSVDREIYEGNIIPKHGPGATADRLTSNRKWEQSEWTQRLEEIFPCGEFLLPNWRYNQNLEPVQLLEPGAERPVRVVSVPKTLKTPRIIAIEPVCMQYVQQGILAAIWKAVERDDLPRRLVGWRSAVPNQHLAAISSRNGALATLDLKEASDRISNQLVRRLFRNFPSLARGAEACRSRKADVPGFGRIRLAKYASMGSALTFPIESLLFCSVIFVGIEKALNRPITRKDINVLSRSVRVYGDDIIVPVDYVQAVISELENFGFRVNTAKSFWTGKFRESCGKEYYDGEDVSIVRVRRLFPSHRTDHEELISTVSLRNQMFKVGLWRTAAYLDSLLESLIPFPVVSESSPVLGRHSSLPYKAERMSVDYQAPLVRGLVVKADPPASELDGLGALLKVLVTNFGDRDSLLDLDSLKEVIENYMPVLSEDHLHASGRSRSVSTKTRWASPF